MSDISSRFRVRPPSDRTPPATAPVPPQPKPSFAEPIPEPPLQAPHVPVAPPPSKRKKPSKKKQTILTVLVALFLIGAGAAGAWFVLKESPEPSSTQADTTQPSDQTAQKAIVQSLTPTAIAYAYGESGGTQELFWRPVTGGDRTSAKPLSDNQLVTSYDISGSQVISVVSAAGDQLWYSKDSGKTYTQIFSSNPAPFSDQLHDTITSVTFSHDGSSIIFAFLPSGSNQNTIKEINPETKQVTDLFAIESPGVLLKGYLKNTGEILYYRGCYQCSQPPTQLLKRSMSSSSDSVLYEENTRISEQVAVDRSGTKLLILNSTRLGDTLGGEAPYYITEVNVSSAEAQDLLVLSSVPTDTRPRIGYSDADETVYYSSGSSVYSITDGVGTKLFEAASSILDVFLVDDKQVIASSGDHNDFTLTNYNIQSGQSTIILSGDANTTILGVTYN